MKIDNLDIVKHLIADTEGGQVEFKKTTGQLGRGIKLMVDECRRAGIPDPEFHSDGGFVWVVFHYTRTVAGHHPSTVQVPSKQET